MMKLKDYKGEFVLVQDGYSDTRAVSKEDLKELIECGEIISDALIYVAQQRTISFNANNFMGDIAEQEDIDYDFCSLSEEDELKLQKLLDQVAEIVNRKNINWYDCGERLDISELFEKEE